MSAREWGGPLFAAKSPATLAALARADRILPPIPQGRLRAAEAAAGRAGREIEPDWLRLTCASLLRWAVSRADPWLVEDGRAAVEALGNPPAPDQRAWGAVSSGLSRQGFITRVAFKPASDGSPKSLWTITEAGRIAAALAP